MNRTTFYALGWQRPSLAAARPHVVVLACRSDEGTVPASAPELVAESRSPDRRFAVRLASLGSGPIVGFDLKTLAPDLDLEGWSAAWIDLLELGSFLLPGASAHSEMALRTTLALPASPTTPDAEIQARSAAEVFRAFMALVDALDFDTLAHLNRLAAPIDWPYKPLFAEAEQRQLQRLLAVSIEQARSPVEALGAQAPVQTREPERLVPSPTFHELDPQHLADKLGAGGPFASRLHDFEQRSEQQAMVARIAETFNQGGRLLVEAGTGTGKSLAYLVPAAHFATANNRPVVVSTNTINLQDQLFHKDLPAVRDATGLALHASVLKGRTNYLCLRRWQQLLRSEQLEPHERTMLIKTLLWVSRTERGDRAELHLTASEEQAWGRVCASADACTPQRCQFHRAGVCFLARARRAAEASHLIVVNHALLLADAIANNTVLPDYEHLIVDEAHHLEEEATAQFGWRTSYRELLSRLGLLVDPSASLPAGLVRETLRLLGQPAEEQLLVAVQRAREGIEALFGLLLTSLDAAGQRAEGHTTLRLSTRVRAQPAWSEVELAWDEASGRFTRLTTLLGQLLEQVEQRASGEVEAWETIVAELTTQQAYWYQATENLSAALVERRSDLVAWLSRGRNDDLFVCLAPLHVGPLLQEALFQSRKVVILTSATLSTEGHFRYVKERLSLEEADELLLGSPFDYRRAALAYLPTDIPEPTQPGYQPQVDETLVALATELGGRCLVLFTSYAQLRTSYHALREPLSEAGIRLLAQGQDGASRAALLDAFKADQRSVLLGTSSFWEGVDVVGEALSCLIMPRLPFNVPSDPVFEARSEAFEAPFRQFALPQAILRFKQGFGRLIRSRSDRGAVVLLDRRLDTKFYGRSFLRSLPGCTLVRGPLVETASAVSEWLAAAASDAPMALPEEVYL